MSNQNLPAAKGVRRVLSSRDYNFPTDGTTSCDTALASIFIDATNLGGADIVLDGQSALTYKFSSTITLPNNCTFSGTTRQVTVNSTSGISLSLGSNSEVHHITLLNTSPNQGQNISIQSGAHDSSLHHVTIDSTNSTHGIYVSNTGVHDIYISDNRFLNTGYGILFNSGSADAKNLTIKNNVFTTGVGGDAIELNWPYNNWINGSGGSYVLIDSNDITVAQTPPGTSAGFGIGIAGGSHVVISNNKLSNCRNQAIHLEDHSFDITVTNNVIDTTGGSSPNSGNTGINLTNFTNRVVISDNVIRNTAGNAINFDYTGTDYSSNTVISNNMITACANGIWIRGTILNGTTTQPLQNVLVSANMITSCTGSAIGFGGTATNTRIEGNLCDSNAGYGVVVPIARHGIIISRNTLTNNTLGELSGSAQAGANIPVDDFTKTYELTSVASSGTGLFSTVLLGKYTSGLLYVFASRLGGSSRGTAVYRITWDNSKLKATLVSSDFNGSISIPAPTMSGNMLQLAIGDTTNTNGSISATVSLRGTIFYDTVAGSGTPSVFSESSIVRGTAAPMSGTWAAGDICFNTATGEPFAWRCTASGTPGTWIAETANATSAVVVAPVRVQKGDSQSIPAGSSGYAVTFNNNTFDVDGWHSTTTNTSRLTCPAGKSGKYQVLATIDINATSAGVTRTLSIYKNGNKTVEVVSPAPSAHHAIQVSDVVQLVAGDYVEAYVYSADACTTANSNFLPSMSLAFLGT